MDRARNRSDAISSPTRAGLVLLVAAALAATFWWGRHDTQGALIVAAGAAVVALILLAYAWLLKLWRQRRSLPMQRAILDNGAASPNAISEPARRAALDDLRKKFQAGIAKFSAAGKDLYSLPWYIVVGEAGGGKTEAIRHCNVGFPPGLQDYTQGAGGTLNMNWWFTNHAILLDIAGRMLFEEAPAGTTTEWDQFLQLLVKIRSNCPINGMLLVLPADSLITDSADEIEKKAAVIAQQLDHIQRALRVRFPVFVIVTKCDLINGFREFFDNLTDPQLQHQMLGWSNPLPLDEPFSPSDVDRHLRTVRERLIRRRQALLLDPINVDDPSAARLDQVDALFSFPESFLKIAPRLRRYLEMIFVVGEWSPEPLFLRGIYFTSSMREGAALDADLAEALKMPVESLKGDGRSWERERAYFLRDLFMLKVFRERGLVTRATNTRRLRRNRRALVMGTALAGIVALLLFTWIGARKMETGIGEQTNYWLAVWGNWHDRPLEWNIVQPVSGEAPNGPEGRGGADTGWRYNGFGELSFGDHTTTVGKFFADERQSAAAPIDIPWIFRPEAMIRGDLNERRWQAYRRLYENGVVVPVLEAVRSKLSTDNVTNLSPYASPAIGELMRLEQYGAGLVPPAQTDLSGAGGSEYGASGPMLLNLDPLMRFLLSDEDYTRYKTEHRRGLQEAMQWAYAPRGALRDFPSSAMGAGSSTANSALERGIKNFNTTWAARLSGQDPRLKEVVAVQKPLQRFYDAEESLKRSFAKDLATTGPLPVAQWLEQLDEVRKSRDDANNAIEKLEQYTPAGWSLLAVYEIELDRDIEAASRNYEELLAQIVKSANTPAQLLAMRESLASAAQKLPQFRGSSLSSELQNHLSRFDRIYLSPMKGPDGKEYRRYQVHAEIYAGIERLLADLKPGGAPATQESQSLVDRVNADALDVTRQIDAIAPDDAPENEQLRQLCSTSKQVVQRIAQRVNLGAVDGNSNGSSQRPPPG